MIAFSFYGGSVFDLYFPCIFFFHFYTVLNVLWKIVIIHTVLQLYDKPKGVMDYNSNAIALKER